MSGYTTAITLTATALSAAMGTVGAIQQGRAQKNQARYQEAVARQNQQLAEEQASAERKAGYENMVTKRQETAKLIGKQRAAAGASGAAVDVGSNLDLQADTAAQGELDAINAYNQGMDRSYNSEVQAHNFGSQADAYGDQASNAMTSGYLNAASSAVGGIAQMGSVWAAGAGKTPGKTASGNEYWDSALGGWASKKPRH